MSTNIFSKYIDDIKSNYDDNKLTYIDDLISLYMTLINSISKTLEQLDTYYLEISKRRSSGSIEGAIARLTDAEFNDMFRKSKIKALENKMKKEPKIQEYANYINMTLKNDKLAHSLGLKFDDTVATAENTMNNYIILKKWRRELTEKQNSRKK